MALTMEFDSKNNVLRLTLEGVLTDANVLDIFQKGAKYARTHAPRQIIIDISKVTANEVSSDTVRDIARRPVAAGDLARVVVAPKEHSYGLARMFQMLSEKTRPNFHVVHTMAEAYSLLGIESPDFSLVDVE